MRVNLDIFENPLIRESLENIQRVASKKPLGVTRWDEFIKLYPFSGTVRVPMKVGNRVFGVPFYFAVEKVNNMESLRVKPLEGDQYSINDIYGFFGFHNFGDFHYGLPIMVVEGLSDWGFCKKYHSYTLASLSAWLSYRQIHFISNLTNVVILGFDNDEVGSTHSERTVESLRDAGVHTIRVAPPRKDWGAAFTSDYSLERSEEVMMGVLKSINKVSRKIISNG